MTSFTSPFAFTIWGFYCDISDCHIRPARALTSALNVCTKLTHALSRKVLSLTKGKIYKTKNDNIKKNPSAIILQVDMPLNKTQTRTLLRRQFSTISRYYATHKDQFITIFYRLLSNKVWLFLLFYFQLPLPTFTFTQCRHFLYCTWNIQCFNHYTTNTLSTAFDSIWKQFNVTHKPSRMSLWGNG